ncbi:MAG: RsmD family RNA methyltransferase [Prosthecochloris sp.]|nr:RsmD family RNA methyltransferase [Prosthecochloris sp.]
MPSPEELRQLMHPGVLEIVRHHEHDDPSQFALRFHGRDDLPVRAVAEQIGCRRKAARKLPGFSGYDMLYTPRALEQASGERTASWKSASLQGERVMDMTGGLGIDSIFLARRFRDVVYCERDEVLASIAAWNFRQLGLNNIRVLQGDSVEHLKSESDNSFDWIYIDPDRRQGGRRSAALESSRPDVTVHHDLMLRKARRMCVKASPVLELSGLHASLPSLASVTVLSVDSECREVLLFCDPAVGGPVSLQAVCLSGKEEVVLTHTGGELPTRRVADVPGPLLFEPDPAIIKSRLSTLLARRSGLDFLNGSVDYLTGTGVPEGFSGRVFRIQASFAYKPSRVRAYLEAHGISGASILRRDFPLAPEDIRKKFRLNESESCFLVFTRDADGKLLFLSCVREM